MATTEHHWGGREPMLVQWAETLAIVLPQAGNDRKNWDTRQFS